MISDSELLRQEPKVGMDLFFWRDDNDEIHMNVISEVDLKSTYLHLTYNSWNQILINCVTQRTYSKSTSLF